jgi:hypothetical protein
VSGELVRVPDPHGLVHLQLRRFAGCPVCNLHLATLKRRKNELDEAGIREVVVFHSSESDLRDYTAQMPFALIADPEKRLYVELGAESSVRALLDPSAWCTIVEAIARASFGVMFRGDKLPPLVPPGGRYGLPADFLIDPSGTVIARRYGEHADDQWSADELLAHARGLRTPVIEDAPMLEPARS